MSFLFGLGEDYKGYQINLIEPAGKGVSAKYSITKNGLAVGLPFVGPVWSVEMAKQAVDQMTAPKVQGSSEPIVPVQGPRSPGAIELWFRWSKNNPRVAMALHATIGGVVLGFLGKKIFGTPGMVIGAGAGSLGAVFYTGMMGME